MDDEEFVRESLSALFVEQEGYSVFTAITGQDSLDTAKYTKLNVALIDILLPDKDGITLLKELKKLDPDMVCIIITSHADLDNAIEALKGGADSYFK
ncbi:MAG TPA: response regulator, partial [Thermodesulfovibrionia bacterium]|nr:response regulator [Thermodesulfovibrionia bacterium]